MLTACAVGNLPEALDSAEEGLTLLRRVERDSPSLLSWHGPVILRSYASALFSLSVDHHSAGRIQQAIETTRRAAAHYAAAGDQHNKALLLDNLCIYLTQAGQEAEAIEAGRQAVALFAQTGDAQLEASAQANLEGAIRQQRSIRPRRWTRGQ
jgi:tetratricopeptide (TPR) repeat protein